VSINYTLIKANALNTTPRPPPVREGNLLVLWLKKHVNRTECWVETGGGRGRMLIIWLWDDSGDRVPGSPGR